MAVTPWGHVGGIITISLPRRCLMPLPRTRNLFFVSLSVTMRLGWGGGTRSRVPAGVLDGKQGSTSTQATTQPPGQQQAAAPPPGQLGSGSSPAKIKNENHAINLPAQQTSSFGRITLRPEPSP
jgi:hypothetical protein